jgi:hypothetical protein
MPGNSTTISAIGRIATPCAKTNTSLAPAPKHIKTAAGSHRKNPRPLSIKGPSCPRNEEAQPSAPTPAPRCPEPSSWWCQSATAPPNAPRTHNPSLRRNQHESRAT